MSAPSVNIIGCGRLGLSLATLFVQTGKAKIKGIVNSNLASARAAVKQLGQGRAYADPSVLPSADITFITTQDDTIGSIAESLAKTHKFKKKAVVVHCSGSLTSEILAPLNALAIPTASLHPIKSFAKPDGSSLSFEGTYCSIEGEATAIAVVKPLIESLGGIVFEIEKSQKARYHAASVIANNYLVTLHYHASLAYQQSGLPEELTKKLVTRLMQDGLTHLEKLSHANALTGPLQRNDETTIEKHLQTLSDQPDLEMTKALYSALLLSTLPITTHDETIKKAWIKRILN